MIRRIEVQERPVRRAPLGVRFVDPLSGAAIGDGLVVVAYPEDQPSQRRMAVVNRRAIYGFHDLPALRDFQSAETTPGVSAPAPVRFVVEVVDEEARFVPFAFVAELPTMGLFTLDCSSLAGSMGTISSLPVPPAVTLHSAPTRQAAATFAIMRADLWDPVRARPAAWAVVRARAGDGPEATGVADERGQLAIFLPYPAPIELPPGSASNAFPPSPPLTGQSWPIELEARYLPESPVPRLPQLCRTLTQPVATLWADKARTQALSQAELTFGRELTLRTTDGGVPLAELWVTSA